MCDPITIAGVALTAGSVAANSYAQSQVTKARNEALSAERMRQARYDRETDVLNAQSRERYKGFGGQQDQRGQDLGQYFQDQKAAESTANQQAAAELANSALPQSSSNLTVSNEAAQRQKATAFTNAQGEALGNLRSFGDLMGDIGRSQARDASLIGQISGFKQGSANVLPYELEAANQKGNGAKLFGDVLGMAGSVGLSAGLGGGRIPGLTPEALAGYGDPNVFISGTGVLPAGGPATYVKGAGSPFRLY